MSKKIEIGSKEFCQAEQKLLIERGLKAPSLGMVLKIKVGDKPNHYFYRDHSGCPCVLLDRTPITDKFIFTIKGWMTMEEWAKPSNGYKLIGCH